MYSIGIPQRLFLTAFAAASLVWGQAVGPAFFEGRKQSKADAAREAAALPPSLRLSLSAPVAAILPPLSPDEWERLQAQKGPAPVVGVHRSLPERAVALSSSSGAAKTIVEGAWQATVAGRLWRLRITSPEARALRIHFQDFDVGKGSVWLHGAEEQVAGLYSGRGMYGDGDFWSDIVLGDSATVEYLPDPAAALTEDAAPFRIAAVSHIRSVPGLIGGGVPSAGGGEVESRAENSVERLVAAEARSLSSGPPSPSTHPTPASCHLDATCYSDWSEQAAGVARIWIERDGQSGVCSGALLNDRQPDTFVPYFLTAAHCVNTDAEARSMIAYWRYQTRTCDDGSPPGLFGVPRTQGARLLATMDDGLCTNEDGDIRLCDTRGGDATLLRLEGDLPAGTWFQGWDSGSQSLGASVTGIHHPGGSYKRISFGRIESQAHSYHEVSWEQGRTEPGSSGSPLFNGFEGNDGVVIGIASFGRREDEHEDLCLTNPIVGYMKFSDFYPHIRRFLEGEGEIPPPPTVSLTVTPSSIPRGRRATLRWSSANAVKASISPGIGAVATSGSRRVSPTATTTYRITVTSADRRTATDSAKIAVTAPSIAGGRLTSGQPANFRLGPVDAPTLFTGDYSYRLQVPDNASRATFTLNSFTPRVDVDLYDVDLYVRFGQDNDLQDRRVVSDYSSTGLFGNEQIVIDRSADPPLQAGTYFASLGLLDTGVVVEGALTATLQLDESPPVPRISAGGVAIATGTPIVSNISPNAIISVFGQAFAPEGTQTLNPVLDVTGKIAANLADTCLEIGGRRSPLYVVLPNQINAQAPHDLTAGRTTVAVVRGCGTGSERRGPAATVETAAVSPAFFNFPFDRDGRNPIVALQGGGSNLIGPPGLIPGVAFTPAEPGEIIGLFGTGFGETVLQLEAGRIPGAAGALANEVSFAFGGIAVPSRDVHYAGIAPCCAGLYQFALRLPPGVPDGNASVTATVRGVATPAGPFLAVKRR